MRLRLRSTALALSLASALAALPRTAGAADLLDAYRLARQADPVLAAADAARRGADAGVAQARAPLLPQAAAGLALNQSNDGTDTDGRSRSRELSANVSQVIYDGNLRAQLGVAQAQAEAQSATLRAAEQALCVRVASAYFDVLSASDTLANLAAVEDAYRRQADQAEQRYRNGLSALVDVDQARAYHANAQARTIAARSALADAREALTELTGTPVGALKALRAELPFAPPQPADPQAWVDRALVQNPSLLAQQRSVAAAERSIDAARAGHLPTLTASAGVGRASQWPASTSSDANNGRTATSVGLLFSVPLFSGGGVDARARLAYAQRDGAQDSYKQRRRALARETLAQYRNVLAGIGQIEVGRTAVDAARKAFEATSVGLSLGTQTMTDLLLAIQTLSGAQDALSQARHRYVLNRLQLQLAAGEIAEPDLAAVNALLE